MLTPPASISMKTGVVSALGVTHPPESSARCLGPGVKEECELLREEISIVIADDHAVVRGAIARYLEDAEGITVLASESNAEDALDAVVRLRPHIGLFDIDMPGLVVFDAARTIAVQCPETRIIFLSAHASDRYIEQALAVKASGYITKGEAPETVLQGIRAVAAGRSYYSPEVHDRILVEENGASLAQTHTRTSTLTTREVEVLEYLAKGLSKKEIAGTMHIAVKTVENHCTNLMRKLDIHDRVELTRFAIREGFVQV